MCCQLQLTLHTAAQPMQDCIVAHRAARSLDLEKWQDSQGGDLVAVICSMPAI